MMKEININTECHKLIQKRNTLLKDQPKGYQENVLDLDERILDLYDGDLLREEYLMSEWELISPSISLRNEITIEEE